MSSLTPEIIKQIEILKQGIDKKYGENSLRILGGDEVSSIPRLPTGAASLDQASGGGWPWGRIIEIIGPESSGKTTLTLEAIAQAQKQGKVCAFIDAEHALDVVYAKNLGVIVEDLLISQPDTAEEALDVVDMLSSSGTVNLIVVDSVAALVPKKELEGEMGDSSIGVQARLMSQAMRKLTGQVSRNNVLLFFINQIRYKIGVMFGNPETTSGGNALKFYASIRCDVRRTGTQKDGEDAVANETRVKFIKNKVAPPYKQAEFIIRFGTGIDKFVDLLRVAVKSKIVQRSGAWYSYKDTRLGQGERNAALFLEENEDIAEEIRAGLRPKTVEDPEDVSTRNNDLRAIDRNRTA